MNNYDPLEAYIRHFQMNPLPKYEGVSHAVIDITPKMALEWLERNTVNRNLSRSKMQNYAADMQAGKWYLNGDTICFRKDGTLANGQHRLMAISQQAETIPSLVVYGIDDGVSLYDRGRNRGLPDIIGVSRERVALAKACVVAKGAVVVSDGTVSDFLEKHQETVEKVFTAVPRTHKSGATLHNLATFDAAVFYALKSGVSEKLITEFWCVARSGLIGSATNDPSPCLMYRNDIMDRKINPISGGADRRNAIYAAEKAIFDYAHNNQRKKTYSKQDTPVYSDGVEI